MTFTITASGAALEAIERIVPQLVVDGVAGRLVSGDATLWGEAAEPEASIRLGWVEAAASTRGLVDDIEALRKQLRQHGVDRIALAGMGGSSLAPEVITRTAGVNLTVLDSTEPGQVRRALRDGLQRTALVVSSKSGSTLETDSQRRAFEAAYRDAGIDPTERIIVVTDPGSPLDQDARRAGYRVFNADPNVGGRYSALTAFGIVPSGLAGVDVRELLDEAVAALPEISEDADDNPGLMLAAAIAGTRPLRDKLGIVADGTHIVGLGDWAEQLIAESTGKDGVGILPVVLEKSAPELSADLPDLQVVRLVGSAREASHVEHGEVEVAGTLGAQLLVWEFATAVAGRLLGINPFDQPDVESAKVAARGLLDALEPQRPADVVDAGIEVRGTAGVVRDSLEASVDALLAQLGEGGYVAVHAYLDRIGQPRFERLRAALAARTGRPVTFGWGPRFLHSTGQYHKGGTPNGVFLQLLGQPHEDLDIPGRPFTFGQLLQAQASGDASVLAEHGRPVLSLTLSDLDEGLDRLLALAGR
ncbi:glucose-6-phosphate isomerase [Agrococcus sediminis]|jgi:glucose-6-phosphate isomerase|uniref:Glucose-6-phosphate isomerase n=1 Tax=Agrococcus sediminis TaxID=2599924 RepID=A0A5M8QFK1_9MICO|nr:MULTISPECIES: glucose-6-phosphate isomerase [Agrococcus]KAA6433703.1 glucose-6-phosphate isomerase [Agrococcus sediminis]UOW00463.1 glucose-6-phosphate isomerase [Agrococcus sp. SCSIO52902]